MTSRAADLLLVFPPYWDIGHAYLSVPTLAGFLRQEGFKVEVADLNRDTVRALLKPEALESAIGAARVHLDKHSFDTEDDRDRFRANLEACEAVWRIAGIALLGPFQADAPLPQTLDDQTAFRRKLLWAYRIVSAPLFPLSMTLSGLQLEGLERLSVVVKLASKERRLPGAAVLSAFAQRHAGAQSPVLGLSVAGPAQMAPALFLGRRFKEINPLTVVCVGGAQIPYTLPALDGCHEVFRWVDAFVSGEGERPLRDLLTAVRAGHPLESVKGLHLYRGGEVVSTGAADVQPLEDLPPPDFRGFEPHTYPGNDGTLALTFARGCSWSRCAFCTQFACFSGYRVMDDRQVEEHLRAVVDSYEVKTINLNDENLTPKRLLAFGRAVRHHAPRVKWQALARYAPQLARPEVAEVLYASGCRILCLGLESASEQVIRKIGKGIRVSNVPKVVRTLHNAGIWVHTFVIFGLPGETRETAVETIQFLYDNRHFIDSMSPTVFRMERLSLIAENPASFGIVPATIPADHFDASLPIEATSWLGGGEMMMFLESLVKTLVGNPSCPIEQGDLTGQFILDFIARTDTLALRKVMRRRGIETAKALRIFEEDDGLFGLWLQRLVRADDSKDVLDGPVLALPERGVFVDLQPYQRLWLKLRAIGIPMSVVGSYLGRLSGSADAQTELEWSVEAFLLSLLGTRLVQEAMPAELADSLNRSPRRLTDPIAP